MNNLRTFVTGEIIKLVANPAGGERWIELMHIPKSLEFQAKYVKKAPGEYISVMVFDIDDHILKDRLTLLDNIKLNLHFEGKNVKFVSNYDNYKFDYNYYFSPPLCIKHRDRIIGRFIECTKDQVLADFGILMTIESIGLFGLVDFFTGLKKNDYFEIEVFSQITGTNIIREPRHVS